MDPDELITPQQAVEQWIGEDKVALSAAVITWGQRTFDAVTTSLGAERWAAWPYADRNLLSVNKNGVCVLRAPIGSPGTIMMMEEIRALGATSFVGFGLAGGISSDLRPGGIVIPTGCISEEGTSHHYGGSQELRPSPKLLTNLTEALTKKETIPTEGRVWTTDAPYRETTEKVQRYRAEGVLAVDMETSAMYAFGRFRNVQVCNVLVVADTLGVEWDPAALRAQETLQDRLSTAAASIVDVVMQERHQ